MIRITAIVIFEQVGDGPGGSYMLGQSQAEYPGFGGTDTYGVIGSAQRAELRVAELVPGGDSPTSGNFATAFTSLATDLGTKLAATPNPFNGSSQTLQAIINGWPTGTP